MPSGRARKPTQVLVEWPRPKTRACGALIGGRYTVHRGADPLPRARKVAAKAEKLTRGVAARLLVYGARERHDPTYAKARAYNRMKPEAFVPYAPTINNPPAEVYYTKACTHFIGLSKDEYWSALRVWGTPDFVHPRATWSCMGEIDRIDTVILGRGAFNRPKKWRAMAEQGAHFP